MKPTRIEFQFDTAKLEAINLFLKEGNNSLSDELKRFMDNLYKTHVPQQVREFIEKREREALQNASTSRPSSRRKPDSRPSEEGTA